MSWVPCLQMGSYVPADAVAMTPLDGVFTRMGANDNIFRGRSTFLEELSEASSILAQASPRSLVIMDELGRGTSTHDGMAIADATLQVPSQGPSTRLPSFLCDPHARLPGSVDTSCLRHPHAPPSQHCWGFLDVPSACPVSPAVPGLSCSSRWALYSVLLSGRCCAQYLVQEVKCLTLFVTHYPWLAHIAEELPQSVGTFHVSFLMQEEGPTGTPNPTEGPEPANGQEVAKGPEGSQEAEAGQQARISFLYKLVPGVARSSFGLNVARMAQVGAPSCAPLVPGLCLHGAPYGDFPRSSPCESTLSLVEDQELAWH